MSISENIQDILQTFPDRVKLLAATKTRPADEILEAINAGITVIGENYVQEAEQKYGSIKGRAKIHLIGHLQTNKVKKALEIFDLIETVDSLKLAKEISKHSKKEFPILIEINIAEEDSKTGVTPGEAEPLIKDISRLENVKIKGLMTMAPFFDDPEKDRPFFKKTKQLFDNIKSKNIPNVDMEILSMGMSDSYKIAIEEGANLVRLGTKIFGRRD